MTYKGIFPATITPMNEDFSIDFESFKNYLNWLKNQGVSGFAINVDTGEGPSLTSEERRGYKRELSPEEAFRETGKQLNVSSDVIRSLDKTLRKRNGPIEIR